MNAFLLTLVLLAAESGPADLAIIGPNTAKVNESVRLKLDGLPAVDLTKTMNEQLAWVSQVRIITDAPATATEADYTLDQQLSIKVSPFVWSFSLDFRAAKPGDYVIIVGWFCDAGALVHHRVQVGGGGPPPNPPEPGTAPWPSPGLTVVVLRESQELADLPVAQRAIFTSSKVHQQLSQWCAKLPPDNKPGYRFWDDDSGDAGNAPPVLQEAFKVVKSKMTDNKPMVGICNGTTGIVAPLPASVDEFLKLVEAYK